MAVLQGVRRGYGGEPTPSCSKWFQRDSNPEPAGSLVFSADALSGKRTEEELLHDEALQRRAGRSVARHVSELRPATAQHLR